jgi:DNA-binding cell septation regulator SpoVG
MINRLTEIQVVPVKPNNGLVGFASFVFDSCIYLGSIGIYTRPQGGFRLTYPTRGSFNIFHPINKQIADEIEKAVINKFEDVMNSYAGYNQTNT